MCGTHLAVHPVSFACVISYCCYHRLAEVRSILKRICYFHGQSGTAGIGYSDIVGYNISCEKSIFTAFTLFRCFCYTFLLHFIIWFFSFWIWSWFRELVRWYINNNLSVLHLYNLFFSIAVNNEFNIVAVVIPVNWL